MVAPGKVHAPPPPGQGRQTIRAAGVATPVSVGVGSESGGYQGTPRTTSATQHSSEVLHQRSKVPAFPARMAVAGVAVAGVLGYLTLYTKKKPEATALDVAKVATGTATTEHTHPVNKSY